MQNSPQEIKLLQSCINDLISVLALPAIWSGGDSSQVVTTLLDALVGMLRLDFAYARFLDNSSGSQIDILRLAKGQTTSVLSRNVGLTLKDRLTNASPASPALIPNPIGEGEVFVASLRLGLHDEIGFLVAASRRRDFPTRIETLLLRVAANQAVVGLQEAQLMGAQKQTAEELERKIADRTRQVTAINAELVREIGVRERAEDELRKAKERVETILESITDKFFAVDSEWRYTHFNKHAEEQLRLLGKNPANLSGKVLWDEFPNPGSAEQLRRAMSEREAVTDEQYFPLLGEWYENRVYPNPDGGLAIFQRYVTQRKQAEQRLLKSEEKYRTLFDSIDEGFCTIEVLFDGKDKPVDYRFLEINPSFEKHTGIKNALGRTMREIAPQHEENWFEIYGKIALTGAPARFENPAADLHRWYDVYAFRVGKPHERKVAVLFKDITKRKRAEEKLRRNEMYLTEGQRLSHTASWAWNVSTGEVYWSAELFRIYGGDPDQAEPGYPDVLNYIHPDDRARVQKAFEDAVREQREYELAYRVVRSDGTIRHVNNLAHPVFNQAGTLIEYIGTTIDTTERIQAEEKLRRSEANLADGQRLSHTGSWAWNPSSGEIFSSQELLRIFGLEPLTAPLTHETFLQLVHPEARERIRRVFDQAIRDRKHFEVEYRLVRPDGSIRYHRGSGHPVVKDAGELEFVGTVMDVTEQKQAEEAVRKAHEELAHVSRLTTLGELTASIAHEVNQPLAAIVTNGQASLRLLSRSKPDIDEARDALESMIADSLRASEVIDRIRTLLRKTAPAKST